MGKIKAVHSATAPGEEERGRHNTLSDIQANPNLWYKVHVLIYDLCNISSDPASEARTLQTTDELYISAPYFTPSEANLIKATQVSQPILTEIPEFETIQQDNFTDTAIDKSTEGTTPPQTMRLDDAIKSYLQTFFQKRRASGDARPCGPHDMGPIYRAVFGITKEELRDEKFLGRLRRAGLGEPRGRNSNVERDGRKKDKGGKSS